MRKVLVIAAVLGLCAVMAIALEVTSENVAGYYRVTLPPGGKLIALGVQFDPFDATLEGIIDPALLREEEKDVTVGDRVMIWRGAGYDIFKRSGDHYVNVNSPTVPTNPAMEAGQAIWVKSALDESSPLELPITGQAVENVQIDTPIVQGLQLIAYPFSCDIGVNDTTFSENASREEKDVSIGDRLMLWDPETSGYKILKLGAGALSNAWVDVNTPTVAATNRLDLGNGFWYRAEFGGFDWSETNRYVDNL